MAVFQTYTKQQEENYNENCSLTGNWNVGIMMPGLSKDPPEYQINKKNSCSQQQIKTECGHSLSAGDTSDDLGTLKEKGYTFFWQGASYNKHRHHGVCFAVNSSLLNKVEAGINESEPLLTL